MAEEQRYVPAAGLEVLTPLYDGIVRVTMREGFSRGRFAAQICDGLAAGARVLEIGCGTGGLTEAIVAELPAGATVTGLDGDERVLARARERVAGTASELVTGNAAELAFADASFDRVVASLLLHHLNDVSKARALAEARRVTAPGGRLHVADWGPPRGAVPRAGFAVLSVLDGRENTRAHGEGRLPGLIEAAGFGPVALRGRVGTVFGTLELLCADAPVG
jgi:SAM-dependent methyltransferase